MTMGCPEFDGDSQVSSAHWFRMPRSDGPPNTDFTICWFKPITCYEIMGIGLKQRI